MMLIKGSGKINEIVYNNTAYYNGKYRYYPTITGLNRLLDEIISSNSTTEYIYIRPFYRNELVDGQIQFEEYTFYIECRDWFDEEVQKKHIIENLNVPDTERPINDFRLGSILHPLCLNENVDSFKGSLEKYKETLRELLPVMMEIAKSIMKLTADHLPFGYFCFEVSSG